MKKLFGLCVLLVSLVFPMVSTAQEPWELTVLVSDTVYTLSAMGVIQEVTLPELTEFDQLAGVALSPDSNFLVFVGTSVPIDGTYPTAYLYSADLEAGTCCTQYGDPLNSVMDNVILGNFSPDGSQIAVLLYHNEAVYEDSQVESLVTTFDLATGNVTANLGVKRLASVAGEVVQGALFGGWEADGIRLRGSCLACEPAFSGSYQIWNPVTGDLSNPVEPFDIFKTQLTSTGEAYSLEQDLNYPANTVDGMMVPIPNVIKYYPTPEAEGEVIFFDAANFQLSFGSGWIFNGEAIFFRQTVPTDAYTAGQAYLLFRDGQSITLPEMDSDEYFYAAVPDGFITQKSGTNSLIYYTLSEDSILSRTALVENLPSSPQLLAFPLLGEPTQSGFTPLILE